ncbi:MAG: hypothetical protein E7K67_07935, partial [Peptostreptococcaceae bacterium]|nr:hypothetical protein [Peptostreptococcaceae bacterium]
SVAGFRDSNSYGGITIIPKEQKLEKLDRANLHLNLVSNQGTVDLGERISKPVKLLDLEPSTYDKLRLIGEAGKEENSTVDEKGVSEKFSLVFEIKKKN